MTGIEGCSVSARSHPLVDSPSGQSWSAITVAGDRNLLDGRHNHDLVGVDVTDGDRDLCAFGPLARWRRRRSQFTHCLAGLLGGEPFGVVSHSNDYHHRSGGFRRAA
jgi:hypothetical protein